MAKAIQDLFINQGYPYDLNIDMQDSDGLDLENDYSCYFECDSIGQLQFDVVDERYELTISAINTRKIENTLEDYVVYILSTSDSVPEKLMSGRIHIDSEVRS